MAGVSLIPTMIGMFAISEILRWVDQLAASRSRHQAGRQRLQRPAAAAAALLAQPAAQQPWSATGIGVLPGAGADIAAWVTYAMEKRFSKEPEKFGTGYIEGWSTPAPPTMRPGRRLDPGAGVRHSRQFDHRDRDRRALHEGHEPRADDHAGARPSCSTRSSSPSSSPTSCCCRWATPRSACSA